MEGMSYMKRKIYLQSKQDLWYLAGALCHGSYSTTDYENNLNYKDESEGRTAKFDIQFILPHTLTLEELIEMN